VIFGSLIVIGNHANLAEPLFGLLTSFFWFYMVFEAYKTCKARQMGLPAPELLGIDRMFGIHEAAPPTAPPTVLATPTAGAAGSDLPNTAVGVQPARHDRGPTGAVILIGLGGFFLLGNMGMLHIGRMWPGLIIGLGLWIAFKRTARSA